MKDFSNFLGERLKRVETEVSQARRDIFELQKDEEYDIVKRISKLCGGCRRCGYCCSNFPCRITESEIQEISDYLDMSPDDFQDEYVVEDDEFFYLETPCPFLKEDKTCQVYSVRPAICKWHPIKILLPSTYQIHVSEECGVGNEIGQNFDKFREEKNLSEIKISDKLEEALTDFSGRSDEIVSGEGDLDFLFADSSTLKEFFAWLKD